RPPADPAASSLSLGTHRSWHHTTRKPYDQHDRGPTAIALMAGQPEKSTGEQFSLRLKAFYAALFLTLGVQLPFLPVWLTAKGLDAGAIGIVLAIPAVIRIVAIPVATRMADRRDAVRGVIILASAAAAAGFAALAFAQGAAAIMLVYALASAAYAPVMMLA